VVSLKRSALVFLSILSLSSVVHAEPVPPAILKGIKPLTIKSVDLSSGVLRVVMSRPMVSLDMYHAVAITGACWQLIGNPKGWGNARIDRIEVLNDIATQGFALEDARKTCTALGPLHSGQERKYVEKHTIPCVVGSCRRR
jgi:hypothetical protein